MRCFRGGRTGRSQRSSARVEDSKRRAHLVELVAEVYGVDVVALEVGEHDDLRAEGDKIGMRKGLEVGG